jgi:hypothetical protein
LEVLYEESVSFKNLKFYYSWTLLLNMREKNMADRPLTNDQRSKEYYRIAYQSAEVKSTRGCNSKCVTLGYGKMAIRLAGINTHKSGAFWGRMICVAILLILILCSTSCVLLAELIIESIQTTNDRATPEITQQVLETSRFTMTATLNGGNYDVNTDSLVNCIDAAIVFYAHYWVEYDKNAKIIWNYNPNTQWSHLFVAVPNGYGDFIYIESTVLGYKLEDFEMNRVWGKAYNPIYNKDVTDYGEAISNGTYVWRW